MKKFVVERNLPGAANLSPEELQAMAQTWCEVTKRLNKPYYWIESFITDDKICLIPKSYKNSSKKKNIFLLFKL